VSDNLVQKPMHAIRADIAELRAGRVKVKHRVGLPEGRTAATSPRLDRAHSFMEFFKPRLGLVGSA
jgi:hypothetical protein